jgi:DNA polymerase III alpha subunit
MLPLFKSHYSIGKSILTLDDPKKTTEDGSDSIFKIAKDNSLTQIILVEDTLIGFFEAFKRSKELGIQLVFGLRLSMRNSSLPDDENSQHKIIVFAKNANGCKLLNKIYSKAFCDFSGFLDYRSLKDLWNNNDLKLGIPFYDSFLYMNHFSFNNCLPDLSFCEPHLLIEDNNLAFDYILKQKVLDFTSKSNLTIHKSKSIYYKNKKDSIAFQTYKMICNRSMGKERSLQRPELSHFCSDEFCFEAWKEQSNVTI